MSINLKLRGRLFAMVSLALAGMLIIGVIALASLRAELLHDRELKTKDLVDAAASIAMTFTAKAASGAMTEDAAKQATLDAIPMLRYDGNNYFWINGLDGVLLGASQHARPDRQERARPPRCRRYGDVRGILRRRPHPGQRLRAL